jgi:hypothetical protein
VACRGGNREWGKKLAAAAAAAMVAAWAPGGESG